MNTAPAETAPVNVEQLNIPPEYDFMSVERIESLREVHSSVLSVANREAQQDRIFPSEDPLERLKNGMHEDAERYVRGEGIEEDNPLFGRLVGMVEQASYYNNQGEAWSLGPRRMDGSYDESASGRSIYEASLRELFGERPLTEPTLDPITEPEPDVDPTVDPDAPTDVNTLSGQELLDAIDAANDEFDRCKESLAKLTIERSRRLTRGASKKSRNLESLYELASENYQNALVRRGQLEIRQLENNGETDPAQLRLRAIEYILNQKQASTQAEIEYLKQDQSRGAKISRWLAGHKWAFMGAGAATGFGIGYGLKKASKGALFAALGIGAPVALGAAAAIKTSRGFVYANLGNRVHQHRNHGAYSEVDHDELKQQLHENTNDDHDSDEILNIGADLDADKRSKRVESDIRGNKRRVAIAMALGGAAAAAGDIVGGIDFNGTHHAASSVGNNHAGNGSHRVTSPTPAHVHSNGGGHNHNSTKIDGFDKKVNIYHGEGYDQALTNLAAEKHINLTGEQSYQAYQYLSHINHGHFLNTIGSYQMNNTGEWGISHPGSTTWNANTVHEFNRWLLENTAKSSTS